MARLLGRRWLVPLRRRWLVLPQRRRLGRLGRLTSARARLIGLPLWVRLLGWLSFGLTMGLRLRVAWLSLTSLTRLARSQPSKLRRRHGQSRRIRPGRAQLGAAETEGAGATASDGTRERRARDIEMGELGRKLAVSVVVKGREASARSAISAIVCGDRDLVGFLA